MDYHVIMIDYGRSGLEAIVHPEDTRRATVDRVREAIGDNKVIAFIHQIRDCVVEDVTQDLLKEAGFFDTEPPEVDHRSIRNDHNRDLRKNYEPAAEPATFEPAWP